MLCAGVIVFKKSWFISLILIVILVGAVLASGNGFAWSWPAADAGGEPFYSRPVRGAPIEVTGVSWHVRQSDYRYIDEAILRLRSTDGKSHLVKLYLTLADSDGEFLFQGERKTVVKKHITTVVYFLEDVAAADVTGLSITAIPPGRPR